MELESRDRHKFFINKSNGKWISLREAEKIRHFVRSKNSLDEFLKEFLGGNYIEDYYKGFIDKKQTY